MKNKKVFLWSDNQIYLIAVILLTIIIGIYQPVFGMVGVLISAYLVYYSFVQARNNNEKLDNEIENLSDTFESATKHAIFNMPFPLVIIKEGGSIDWYNTPFLDMITEKEILNKRIQEIISDFDLDNLLNTEEDNPLEIKYDEKYYLVYPNFIGKRRFSDTDEKKIILYWVHNTDYAHLEQTYKDEQSIVSLIYIDNYDDVRSSTPDINRPLLLAEIDKKIGEYFSDYKALIRKYENDKYLIVINNAGLNKIQEKKFD